MKHDEAVALKRFDHFCTCGGYAWTLNGRSPAAPHMDWCPQAPQYAEWWKALHESEVAP